MRYTEIINESSSMEKFWVNTRSGLINSVEDEHFDDIDCPDQPFETGWVRAGFSYFTDKLHLEGRSLGEIKIATKLLLRDYKAAIGLVYDINDASGSIIAAADLDLVQMKAFIRS